MILDLLSIALIVYICYIAYKIVKEYNKNPAKHADFFTGWVVGWILSLFFRRW